MSKLSIVPTALPNKGIVLNKPEEMLKNNFSTADSRNMEFVNELLQGRLGLDKLDDYQLSGAIQLVDQFWTYSGVCHILVCTTKDIYKYNPAPGTGTPAYFEILTPLYTTGSISVDGTGASPTIVTGSASDTDFTGNALKSGDYFKVGTGSPTSNDTWYTIGSISGTGTGSAAQITLTGPGPSVFDSQFTIRKTFQGTQTFPWQSRTFVDANLSDVWIATNGIDMPVRWVGSGQILTLGTGSGGFTAAKYIEVFSDRVIFLNTVEGGNQPQRIRWSGVADCESWDALDFQDFIEDGLWITGTGILGSSHVVFRERDAYIGRYIGGDYTFQYDKSSTCAGVWSANSLVLLERDAYYYGPDNKFHRWNLLSDIVISEVILPHTKDYAPNIEQYIFGWQVEAKNQIRWFSPFSDTLYNNECIVYDYAEDIIQIWGYEQTQACCSMGEYLNTEDLYMDDTVWEEYYLDEMDGYFDTRLFLDSAPILLYGGYDGYLRIADIGYTDDGIEYNRVFESIRNNYKLPYRRKRLWKQQHWLVSEPSGSVTVKIKKDDANNYELTTASISLIDLNRDVIKKNITWNKEAENFKTRIEATNHFAMLGWLDYIFEKGKTTR